MTETRQALLQAAREASEAFWSMFGVNALPSHVIAKMRALDAALSAEEQDVALICSVCEAAHFDGPGTDGTVSLAEPPVGDHQPVYEEEREEQVAPQDAASTRNQIETAILYILEDPDDDFGDSNEAKARGIASYVMDELRAEQVEAPQDARLLDAEDALETCLIQATGIGYVVSKRYFDKYPRLAAARTPALMEHLNDRARERLNEIRDGFLRESGFVAPEPAPGWRLIDRNGRQVAARWDGTIDHTIELDIAERVLAASPAPEDSPAEEGAHG